jgi:tRNA (uracil-5-)-methyltransferase TRM9
MDWRAEINGGTTAGGLRYVHIFSESELSDLAATSGFDVSEKFYSDGKEGNLGLYQTWVSKI